MLINILVIILAVVAVTSTVLAIYYHLEFQKACRKGFFVSSYKIDLMDQKKTVSIFFATSAFSMGLIIAILKQHYIGG